MNLEFVIAVTGILITAFLGILSWLGKRTIERVDRVHEKTIEIGKAIYEPDGTDKIGRLEDTMGKLSYAIYDPQGTNGLIRKIRRLEARQAKQARVLFQMANAFNVVRDRLDLKYDIIKTVDDV